MKVLIIHQYFKTPESGGALRSYYLARALAEEGIQTIVITTHNSSTIRKQIIEGIEVHYLPVIYDNSFGFIMRIRSFLKFVWSIVKEAGQFRHVDVCYAISTPLTTGIAARWIKMRYKVPYIFEVGDLWPEAPIQLGIVKNPILVTFLRWLEKKIYYSAEEVVALSEPIRECILKTAPRIKVHAIPNMADTEFFKPSEKPRDLEFMFGVQNKFVITYIGTFGLANELNYLLDCAAQSLRAGLRVQFLLCGDGAMKDSLKRRVQMDSLSNVMFIPFQNRSGVRDILNVSDAIFVSFLDKPVLETGSPNKYFDGLAAGKFVITNFGGWIEKEITSYQCGLTVNTRGNDFVQKVERIVHDKSLQESASKAARRLAEERYSRKMLSEKFIDLFQSHRHE